MYVFTAMMHSISEYGRLYTITDLSIWATMLCTITDLSIYGLP